MFLLGDMLNYFDINCFKSDITLLDMSFASMNDLLFFISSFKSGQRIIVCYVCDFCSAFVSILWQCNIFSILVVIFWTRQGSER